MTTIYFVKLDTHLLDGNHFLHFNSKSSRLNYLSKGTQFSGNQNFQPHAFIDELIVPFSINQMRQVNYLYFVVEGTTQDLYCYHIIGSKYNTQTSSTITLKLDVFTTYQFDIQLRPSYIERCHVPRWSSQGIPSKEITPEKFGEYDKTIINSQSSPINDGCYIYTSVNPLGKVSYRPTTSEGGSGSTPNHPSLGGGCGDLNLGIASKNGFLFIKGTEGLAQYSHNIGDGVLTIGYGCTDAYDGLNYTYLKANEPVSDELASEVFANSLTENYGIPLINKLESDGITVSQQEFDALLSFVYNAGLGSLTGSMMYTHLKNGNKQEVYNTWLTQNILVGTQFENGLRARRQAEADMFLKGEYKIDNCLIYGQGGAIIGTLDVPNSCVPSLIENTCQSTTGEFLNESVQDEDGWVWQFPVKGLVSATFPSYPDGTFHSGFDICDNEGLKIRSSGRGVVYYVGYSAEGYGHYVVIEMENGHHHWFAHMLTTPYVSVGQTVDHSTVLGLVGNTGNSSGPHVHWEIRKPPFAYDMTCLINPAPNKPYLSLVEGIGD